MVQKVSTIPRKVRISITMIAWTTIQMITIIYHIHYLILKVQSIYLLLTRLGPHWVQPALATFKVGISQSNTRAQEEGTFNWVLRENINSLVKELEQLTLKESLSPSKIYMQIIKELKQT
jgi:hypothetical protein